MEKKDYKTKVDIAVEQAVANMALENIIITEEEKNELKEMFNNREKNKVLIKQNEFTKGTNNGRVE